MKKIETRFVIVVRRCVEKKDGGNHMLVYTNRKMNIRKAAWVGKKSSIRT